FFTPDILHFFCHIFSPQEHSNKAFIIKKILSLDPLKKTLLCLHVHFPPIGFMVNILVSLDPFVC
ncbi:hypothetical protein, partial [Enterococcus faecalis]|uniref:hypothetical protein n=1 Tax=Enterococcus faecalis TaxID=1351 RepID=UPI001E29604D